ncbi:GIY-YIG nuclease family protein [Lactiplantibacillus plantarum]|nr:GIY-YIG nuclease family protein [Lactiplantibacillus plantarum]
MQNRELIFEYPTVYLIYDKLGSGRSSNDPKFKVYVGETNDISRRTRQHLKDTGKSRMDWKALNESHNSQMIVIGDYYFNKSLTLDIENKLMMYLLSAESVTQLNNRRSNPQRKYFMSDQFENVLEGVWQTLRKKRPEIFPEKSEIENSAVFKASPFHSLNAEHKVNP